MIKAIIFDVDGVLVDSKEANIALYQNILKKAGYPPVTREEILSCFHLPLWQSLEKLTSSNDQAEIKRMWSMASNSSLRDSSLFNFPEGLEQILEELHKTYQLAIVTSRIKAGIEDVFSAKEIKHLFRVVVTFEDYKNPKPHPEPLRVALNKLGLSPTEAIYIGDSSVDIDAAKAAGMRSIYLSTQLHDDASVNINEFSEILGAIKELSAL
ncbi:MAG TPA: HAD family hydrolase [Candidatus Binatia bacterium]|nr:HAD family hydrolase [Candidatus Binatia bacterium]